jgi:PD-(D/E)XK nuclease superfamily
MLERGHYQDGRLLVIAPSLNAECQAAISRFRTELISSDLAETRFQALTLEDFTTAIGDAGADTIAARVTERYLDFTPVHRALAETFNAPPDAS